MMLRFNSKVGIGEFMSFKKGDVIRYKKDVNPNTTSEHFTILDPPIFGSRFMKLKGKPGPGWYNIDYFELVLADKITDSVHDKHEIISNSAGGITFKYCRDCKVEV